MTTEAALKVAVAQSAAELRLSQQELRCRQWLRARAIHAYFKGREGVDGHIYRAVFTFCDRLPQVVCHRKGKAFALLTDWGSVLTWGD